MDTRAEQARHAIRNASIELFAENGINGVSVRTLAKKAGVNVAAINYYFDSKENLYFEVIRHVFTDCGTDLSPEFIARIDAATTRRQLLPLVRELIHVKTKVFVDVHDDNQRRTRLLLLRVFLDEDLSRRMIGHFEKEHMAQVRLFQKLNPELTPLQAQLAVFSMVGQLAFYVFSRAAVLGTLNRESYDDEFRSEVEQMIYRNLKVPLKLPRR